MKKLLGGASFYLAVEVEMQNGQIAVLRLMRDKAHEEAQYGFAHLKETLNLCRHPSILKINKDLSHIIDEAEAGAQIEINHECVGKQYEIADKLYNDVMHKVNIEDGTYYVSIEPVKLFSYGPGYQLISMAQGIEFNDLKKDTNNKNLCEAVAFAVCKRNYKVCLAAVLVTLIGMEHKLAFAVIKASRIHITSLLRIMILVKFLRCLLNHCTARALSTIYC